MKDPNSKHYGEVYDPKSNKWLKWDKNKPRSGQWDMGHIDGQEYRTKWEDYINKRFDPDFKKNEEKFLEWYRNADNYHPEDCSSNRSDNQKSKCKGKV